MFWSQRLKMRRKYEKTTDLSESGLFWSVLGLDYTFISTLIE